MKNSRKFSRNKYKESPSNVYEKYFGLRKFKHILRKSGWGNSKILMKNEENQTTFRKKLRRLSR